MLDSFTNTFQFFTFKVQSKSWFNTSLLQENFLDSSYLLYIISILFISLIFLTYYLYTTCLLVFFHKGTLFNTLIYGCLCNIQNIRFSRTRIVYSSLFDSIIPHLVFHNCEHRKEVYEKHEIVEAHYLLMLWQTAVLKHL